MRFLRRKDPRSALHRAIELNRRGDLTEAAGQYQKAIDFGDPQVVAEAGIQLGIIRNRYFGDRRGAAKAYRAAMDSGHPSEAAKAAFMLAGVLGQLGDYEEAASAYRYVIDSGHELAPTALFCWAQMLHHDVPYNERSTTFIIALYQRTIDTGDPKAVPQAMAALGEVLHANGDLDAAAEWYQRAIDSEHVRAAPMARRRLHVLRESRDEKPDQAPVPRLRPAAGASGCYLVRDSDGEVYGLWFEDVATGDSCIADPDKLKAILLENKLGAFVSAAYQAGPDDDGYLITFRH